MPGLYQDGYVSVHAWLRSFSRRALRLSSVSIIRLPNRTLGAVLENEEPGSRRFYRRS